MSKTKATSASKGGNTPPAPPAGAHTHALQTDGAGAHTHAITTSNEGAHSHSISTKSVGAHSHAISTATGAHSHPLSTNAESTDAQLHNSDQENSHAIGPVALQEVRWKGKTYRPGAVLPAGIDNDTLDRLEKLNAIDME